MSVCVDTSELQRTGIGEAEAARLHRALTDLVHQDLGSSEVCQFRFNDMQQARLPTHWSRRPGGM